jgi:propanol-preferring alcohol dehydrogenase
MEAPPGTFPGRLHFTIGHENAGWVEKLGPGATGFAPGDPVIVYGAWGCGTCANCRVGMENYCESTGGLGGGLGGNDGGMAAYLLGPGSTAVVIGAGGLGQMAIQIM